MRAPRPLRSLLFMPASNARAVEKARTLPCDGVILDLEDSVAPATKDEARAAAIAALAEGGFGGRELIVRANGLGTPWAEDDVAALAGLPAEAQPAALLVPKVSGAADVAAAEKLMEGAGLAPAVKLWVMIESPAAVLGLGAIAGSGAKDGGRLGCLVAGTNDLASELRVAHAPGREALVTSLSLIVLAARAHGLAALDGVYNAIADAPGFEAECRQGRALGFDGKTLIHPSQIEAANAAFTPSAEEVAEARRLLAVWDGAEGKGAAKGVIALDGKMIEELHVRDARRIAAIAAILDL